ncbi:MAG: polysaccharide deacetylase family protein [Eubacteriales bacterium]|nr:polysaccharide deacetylase family protein [Eubacteriales bacterium]
MPGRKTRTNPVLVLIAVLLCLIFGATFTQSSADPSPAEQGEMPDMFVAEDVDDSLFTSHGTVTGDDNITDQSEETEEEPQITQAPVPTEVPEKNEEKSYEASPEAARGIWTSSGSNWMFLVDGTPYTGWLSDTDGNRYFFNEEGIMQTGWLEDGGNRYYLDLDGIMQTGEITVDGETYQLQEDGVLKEAKKNGKADSDKATPTPAREAKEEEKTSKDKESVKEEEASEDKESVKEEEATEDKETEEDKEASEQKESKKENKAEKKKKVQADKTIALTFDDGPSSFTDRLLDCLEENNAKATFFMVGEEIVNFPDEVKRMEELGCELGNHTYSHTDLTELDAAGISDAIGKTDQLLLELAGHGATVLRPPYGSVNDTVVATVGTPMILWSIDTLDWETLDAEKTVDTVLSQVEDGSIILMHDIYKESVDAAEILIPRLIEEGYELVTVHELAEKKGVTLQTGTTYGEIN